jgi:hypothetical protein
MIRATIILTAFFVLPYLAVSQTKKPEKDFGRLDSIARTVEFNGHLVTLAKDLTDPYPDHLSKARAIFVWITDNIKYDYKAYNKGRKPKPFKCKPGMNCEQLLVDWETKYLHKRINKGKAVCDGYSRLFKRMCDVAGVKAEIIDGYTKTEPYHVGLTGPLDHAWNAVWLDTAWFFLDPTWAAGYCTRIADTDVLDGFVRRQNDYYWLTSFRDLARNHYPREAKWVMEANYTKEKYAANPYIISGVIEDLQLLSPASGVISARRGDTIRFAFEYEGSFKTLQTNSNIYRNPPRYSWEQVSRRKKMLVHDTLAEKKQRYVQFTRQGSLYEFDFAVTDVSLYYIEILFDYQVVMRFKVEMLKD